MDLNIRQIFEIPKEFDKLIQESKVEGHLFVEKTMLEWENGENTFNRKGESFFLIYSGGELIGCGGINIDPYTEYITIGRVRHIYISPSFRRKGVAKKLLETLIEYSKGKFNLLRLRSNSVNPDSSLFYRACGFLETSGDLYETHRLEL